MDNNSGTGVSIQYEIVIKIIELAIFQIQDAAAGNDRAVAALTHAHAAIGQRLTNIASALNSDAHHHPDHLESAGDLNEHMNEMVMAFQGHDALNQRLGHVCDNLDALQALLAGEQRDQTQAWEQLLLEIRNSYTMEEERTVFDRVFPDRRHLHDGDGPGSDIELF